MITLADVMVAASKAREAIDKLRDQIDAHEAYASIAARDIVTLHNNLRTLATDVQHMAWVLEENRQAIVRDKTRERNLAEAIDHIANICPP